VLAAVIPAYVVGAELAYQAFGATAIVVLFLSAGVTLSALVLTRIRQWPAILAAIALAEITIDLSHGAPPWAAAGFALANTTEPLVGALLLRRAVRGPVDLLRRNDLVAFVACAVVIGPMVGGLLGGTTINAAFGRPWPEAFLSFWAGDATGVLTVGGAILAWRYRERGSRAAARWIAAILATTAVTAVGFWSVQLPLYYLPIPLLFWLAFRERLAVVVTCGLAMTVTANLMISAGRGPWATLNSAPTLKTATLQLYLGIAILGAWFLAIGVAERDLARSATTAERAARLRLHSLQMVTAQLARAATTEAIVGVIVRDGIGLLADHGIAAVVTVDGAELRTWTTTGRPAVLDERPGRLPLSAATPLADVVRTGTTTVDRNTADVLAHYPELAEVYRLLGIRSMLCVPVDDGDGTVIGALAFGFTADDAVDEDVVAFADALASLTGQALRRARLYEIEVDAARTLQRALLPVFRGELAGVQVTADYRPADRSHDVGGDWYDVFALPGARIGFAVGDVVGHDLAAAAAMARLQAALRIIAQSADGPAHVLDELDRAGALVTDTLMTTVGYADYDPATRRLRYACAGHPPPLLVTAEGTEFLWDGRSMPIGVRQAGRDQAELDVPPDATLVWYTDGLVERRAETFELRLEELAATVDRLGRGNAADLGPALISDMADGAVAHDDTVVLCVRFPAAAPAAASVTRSGHAVG
jgi:serine phosphatase RsbU (regulator of sigma subunit)/integral membrane sensor domain MASE1